MGQNPNTRLINFDWKEPMKSLRIQVDQDRVRQLGVSSKSLAEALNAVTSGMVVTQVRDSIYLTDLVARSPDEQREPLQPLRNLQVALENGQTIIPLNQVASVQYKLEQPSVWCRDLLPTRRMSFPASRRRQSMHNWRRRSPNWRRNSRPAIRSKPAARSRRASRVCARSHSFSR